MRVVTSIDIEGKNENSRLRKFQEKKVERKKQHELLIYFF